MRAAYAALGLAWLIVIAIGAYAFNHTFTRPVDTGETISSATLMTSSTFTLRSTEFEDNASIPSRFTCDAERTVSPALSIEGVPEAAGSLVLIVDDPDVPKALKPDGVFDHWILFNIPPDTREIAEGKSAGVPGANGAGKNAYAGPCPPSQYEPSEHRYFFKLYALDSELPLQAGASRADVEHAMNGHIITQTQLIGRYKRTQ